MVSLVFLRGYNKTGQFAPSEKNADIESQTAFFQPDKQKKREPLHRSYSCRTRSFLNKKTHPGTAFMFLIAVAVLFCITSLWKYIITVRSKSVESAQGRVRVIFGDADSFFSTEAERVLTFNIKVFSGGSLDQIFPKTP